MSRSNPNQNGAPNPAVRWYEWYAASDGGFVRYYDKAAQGNVGAGSVFPFVLLDQLGTVEGYNDESASGIFANQVRDTRQETLIVKSRKGGTIAEGVYKAIKPAVQVAGGHFTTVLYIAAKIDGQLQIATLRFKGGALRAWMDFSKEHRNELYSAGIGIDGYTESKKGKVTFRTPIFKIVSVTPETNQAATTLDKTLQAYLDGYLKKNTAAKTQEPPEYESEDTYDDEPPANVKADDIPF